MDVKDIFWLAGLLEGEGHFMSDPKGSLARIKLEMTDKDVIEHAAELMGIRNVGAARKSNPKHNTTYYFYVCGAKAAGWMMTIFSLMGKRRRRTIKNVLCHWQNGLVAREALRS